MLELVLAAVYQVPFASSLFVFETLGLAFQLAELSTGFDQYLSGNLAQSIVGQEAVYHLSAVSWSAGDGSVQAIVIAFLVTPWLWSLLSSPNGLVSKRRKDRTILWALPLAFMVLGSLVAFSPIFMGNGQVLAQALLSSQPIPYLPLTLE